MLRIPTLQSLIETAVCCDYINCSVFTAWERGVFFKFKHDKLIIANGDNRIQVDTPDMINWKHYDRALFEWLLGSDYVVCFEPFELIKFINEYPNMKCTEWQSVTEHVEVLGVTVCSKTQQWLAVYNETGQDHDTFAIVPRSLIMDLLCILDFPSYDLLGAVVVDDKFSCSVVWNAEDCLFMVRTRNKQQPKAFAESLTGKWLVPAPQSPVVMHTSHCNIRSVLSEKELDVRLNKLVHALEAIDPDLPNVLDMILQ